VQGIDATVLGAFKAVTLGVMTNQALEIGSDAVELVCRCS
jgi:hypothetical protein